jgi:outer membrane protein OmpA-like peptidoglycan-associated protein
MLKKPLAYVRFSGWGLSIPGGDIAHGVTGVLYGDGDPVGFVQADIPFDIAPEPEKVDPRVQITQKQDSLVIKIGSDVLFDFGKFNIKAEAEPLLAQVGAIIRSNLRLRRVIIEGHTDAKGPPDFNLRLSRQRAEATADWLGKRAYLRGLTPEKKGFGASKPIAPNRRPDGSDDPVGRAKNRRVEIFLSYR